MAVKAAGVIPCPVCRRSSDGNQRKERIQSMGAAEWIARLQDVVAAGVRLQAQSLHAAERWPGFAFDETMTGRVTLEASGLPTGERRMQVQLQVHADSLGAYLREGRSELVGTASIEGITEDAPLRGSLWIWPHRRVIRYEFSFVIGEHRLAFAGQKDVRLLDFRHTMSTLPGELYDEQGDHIGRGSLAFNWADLPTFLSSMRLLRPAHSP